jgi:regulator of replication initiation timing
MNPQDAMSRRARASLPRAHGELTRLNSDNGALMDRLGPLMRVMSGASVELTALRRRARQLATENAKLHREIERLSDHLDARQPRPNGQRPSVRAR